MQGGNDIKMLAGEEYSDVPSHPTFRKDEKLEQSHAEGPLMVDIGPHSERSSESSFESESYVNSVSFLDLFKYATKLEKIMLITSVFFSLGLGALMPCFTILFGSILQEMSSLLGGVNIPALVSNIGIDLDFNTIIGQLQNPTAESLSPLFSQIQKAIINLFGPNISEMFNDFWLSMVGLLEIGNYALNKFDYLDRVVVQVAIVLTLMGFMGCLWALVQKTFGFAVAHQVSMRLRRLYLQSSLRQDMTFFDIHHPGEVSSRLSGDLATIEHALGDTLGAFFVYCGVALTGFAVSFAFGWQLALACMAMSPLIAGAGAFMSYIASFSAAESSSRLANAGAVAEEALSLIRTVMAFGRQHTESMKFRKNLDSAYRQGLRRNVIFGAGSGASMFIILGANAWGMWYANELVTAEVLDAGQVLTVFFASIMASLAVGQTFGCLEVFAKARGAAYGVYETIERVPEIDSLGTEGESLEEVKGEIRFTDVTFGYKTSRPVLYNLNLHVKPGQTVALVGGSGSGKSTTVKLIERLYDPDSGEVSLDGKPLRDLNIQWLRSQIGLVSQEPKLFPGTIAENIAMGAPLEPNPDFDQSQPSDPYENPRFRRALVTDSEIEEAAKFANAWGFISTLPHGLNTRIEGGLQLSGGQKQRIAIARALIRKPKILVLDEATSALDVTSEAVVQEALDRASEGRTTIIIAHRLTTIRRADVIGVIDGGCIAELGSHQKLMALNGRYATLVRSQGETSHPPSDATATKPTHLFNPPPTAPSFENEDKSPPYTEKTDERTPPKKAIDKGVIQRALMLNRPEWGYYVLGSVGAMLAGVIWPMFAFVFGQMLFVFISKDTSQVYNWIYIFLGLACAAFIGHLLLHVAFGYANEKLVRRICTQCFDAMLRQDVGWFDERENAVGALVARLTTDATAVKGITGEYVATQVMLWTTVLGAVIIALDACWQLALLMLLSIPLVGAATFAGVYAGRKAQKHAFQKMNDANRTAGEAIDNVRTVTPLGAAGEFLSAYDSLLREPSEGLYRASRINALAFGLAQLAVLVIWGASFYFGVQLVKGAECSVEGMIRAFCAVVFGGMGLGQTAAMMPNHKAAQVAATRIFRLMDRIPPIDIQKKGGQVMEEVRGDIEYRDVVFSYPTRPEVVVMKNLSLGVAAGKTLALVGESGSGKSTLVSLLQRFYAPADGAVLLDGVDVKELDLAWLRAQIGLVSQEPDLFTGTVRENLLYGCPLPPPTTTPAITNKSKNTNTNTSCEFGPGSFELEKIITDDELRNLCERANAWEFVSNLPHGLDSHIGDRGSTLSGGQKQRIAIARALIRNPRILLLDEATSALDSQSERVVQDALKKASAGRTTIVVAHRLSTIRDADVIAVVRDGRVVEAGSHEQLLAAGGLYRAMWTQQAAAFQ